MSNVSKLGKNPSRTALCETVFVCPWGDMRPYFFFLHENLCGLKSNIISNRPKLGGMLIRVPQLTTTEIKSAIQFQVERKVIKRTIHNRKTSNSQRHFIEWRCSIKLKWLYRSFYRQLKKISPNSVCVWSGHRIPEQAVKLAADRLQLSVLHFENGLLPNTTTIDARGVNAYNSLPRDLEFYKKYMVDNGDTDKLDELESKLEVRQTIPEKKVYSQREYLHEDLPEKFVFVPFQVQTDSQILINSPRIRSMRALYSELGEITRKHKDWVFIIKEHPSCPIKYDDLHFLNKNIRFSCRNTEEIIEKASMVATINSSIGFESLLKGQRVAVLGSACFAIEGISKPVLSITEFEQAIDDCFSGNWLLNDDLCKAFLSYVKTRYAVPVAWRKADDAHLKAVEKRITALGVFDS